MLWIGWVSGVSLVEINKAVYKSIHFYRYRFTVITLNERCEMHYSYCIKKMMHVCVYVCISGESAAGEVEHCVCSHLLSGKCHL